MLSELTLCTTPCSMCFVNVYSNLTFLHIFSQNADKSLIVARLLQFGEFRTLLVHKCLHAVQESEILVLLLWFRA